MGRKDKVCVVKLQFMKTLIIVRHAKSSWDDPELPDFKRPLNGRGEKDAPRMAERLKEKNIPLDIVISSPAVRALTTCEIFMDVLGVLRERIQASRELYHAGDEIILSIVRSLKDVKENDVAILFGHNPGLTDFVNNLLEEEIENIPTTGVVCCKLKIKSWSEAKWGCGEMEFFDWPKKGK
jgi:phosphohistidine phosphatase